MVRWRLMILLGITVTNLCLGGENRDESPPDTPSQSWNYRGEVFGTIGWGKFWHGDDSLGSGTDFGGGVGWRPFRSKFRGLGIEFNIQRLSFRTPAGPFSSDGTSVQAMTNVVYHFGRQKVQPFIKGGAGIVRADYATHWISDWYDEQGNHYLYPAFESVRASKFGIDLGAGIKAALGNHFLVRAEVEIVDTTPGEGYNWGVLLLNSGIGYSW